jgi:bacterioferritin-associated ferredoxin
MYVCQCNALTDEKVRQAVHDGVRRPRDLYALSGCRAQCGSCTKTILQIIRGTPSARPGGHENQ